MRYIEGYKPQIIRYFHDTLEYIGMDERLREIVAEAVKTNTISRITYAERAGLVELNRQLTGVEENPTCNACIIKICFTIDKFLKQKGYEHSDRKRT